LFAYAAELEPQGYFEIKAAVTDVECNWATHLSKCILGGEHRCQAFCFQAPIRAAAFGQVLKRMLRTLAEESIAYQHCNQRLVCINSSALQLARVRITHLLENSRTEAQRDLCFKMLVYLGLLLPERLRQEVRLIVPYEPLSSRLLASVSG